MRLRLLSLAAVLLPIAAHAQSTIGITDRETMTTITPGAAADFSDASFVYANHISFNTVAGTETVGNLNIASGAMDIDFSGLGTTVVTPATVPDGTTFTSVSATSPGGSGQGFLFGYHGGDTGFLSSGVSGGQYDLTFAGGGDGIVDPGGTFNSTVAILGDFSSMASHTTPMFAAGYSILQNFVFFGGYTYFTVGTDNYQNSNPAISFSLLGDAVAAVPEPATWAIMLLGFGLVGGVSRRARRQTPAMA